MGTKKYQIIYADPPWQMKYAKELRDGFVCEEVPYVQMTIDEIKGMNIKGIVDKNAILFMWCIDAYITHLASIMERWGFKYVTVGFVWNKVTPDGGVNALVSQYTRKSCEFCYIGRRGKMLVKNPCSVNQYVASIKGEHSRKPNVIRNNIVKLCGDLPRIELFARRKVNNDLFGYDEFDGWDVWGNEAEGSIDLEARAQKNNMEAGLLRPTAQGFKR